ncbi:hypothetical protein Tco_0517993 [Tanacetum coccineum]
MLSCYSSELELKRILIDKMEANKSINRSDIQRQLHKALVDAYEADKILLDTYGDTVTIKRPRDGADDDQEPSAGTDRGSKIKVGNYANLRCLLIALLIMSLKGVHVNKRKKKSSSFPELVQQPNSTTFIPIMHGTKFCTAYVFMNPSTLAADYGHIKWIEDLVPNSKWSQVIVSYDKIRSLGNLTLGPRSGGQFYAFATIKGNLLVGVFTSKRRIIDVTKRAWEDFYLGVEKAIKRKSTSHALSSKIYLRRSSLAFTPYSDPRGFIYENKDKKNRFMHIDELHKFSDGTLDDVRTALNDRLKGIRMEYLPQTFWSQRDKANARAMIQAIDKRFKSNGDHAGKLERDLLGDVKTYEYDESNTYVLERFNTTAGNPVKKILLKLNLLITGYLKMVVEVPDSS